MSHLNKMDNVDVQKVFQSYPESFRQKLLFLRALIFSTASEIESVGELEETLKWGQVSYLTTKSKSGSTIRIDKHGSDVQKYAIYFNCQTRLVDTFREIYAEEFNFEGNRSIVFELDEEVPVQALRDCISMALTYHRNKQ